jgi:hypothetical protein
VDIQTISIIIAAASVIIAMINSILDSKRAANNDRITLETRQMNNFLEFAKGSQTKEFMTAYHEITLQQQWNDVNEWYEKYGPHSDPDAFVRFTQICEYFNTMGLLVKTGIVDENIPYEQGADAIIGIWKKVKPIVYSMRTDSPGLYTTFEYFADKCKQIRNDLHV